MGIDRSEAVGDLELRLARTRGELDATQAQLAGLMAAEAQWRVEVEAAKEDAASCRSSLTHLQQRYEERLDSSGRQATRLEAELSEARRLQKQAEDERAAVIAAMGRRARKHLQAGSGE